MQDGQKGCFIVGTTDRDTIIIMEVENGNRGHFSCTTDEVSPIPKEKAIERERRSLADFFHNNDEFPDTKVDDMSDHKIFESFDNSLETHEFDIEGTTWVFESYACGQCRDSHDDIDTYYMDEELHQQFLEEWDEHHLEDDYRTDLELPDQDYQKTLRDVLHDLVDQGRCQFQ